MYPLTLAGLDRCDWRPAELTRRGGPGAAPAELTPRAGRGGRHAELTRRRPRSWRSRYCRRSCPAGLQVREHHERMPFGIHRRIVLRDAPFRVDDEGLAACDFPSGRSTLRARVGLGRFPCVLSASRVKGRLCSPQIACEKRHHRRWMRGSRAPNY